MPDLLVLLTNDDGVSAPGIVALREAFAALSGVEVWTVAPDGQRSTCSHGMTLNRPLFGREIDTRVTAFSGLTADCVYHAMFHVLPRRPDVVVSGINNGANLGTDVVYSGTVAGAREAVIRGVPGVAASLVSGDDFAQVAPTVAKIALELADMEIDALGPKLLNLNFPGGPFDGPEFAPLGNRVYPEIVHSRTMPLGGDPYYWIGGPPVEDAMTEGSDGWLISKGVASATFLTVDQTDHRDLTEMDSIARRGAEEQ